MSCSREQCPGCREALRPEARYCALCGLEVRHPCPTCLQAPRWLKRMDRERSPWCESCDALLDACEQCGRWLLAGTQECPNPACRGRVLPLYPQHTGRRWDGKGSTVEWKWPPRWERFHPEACRPVVECWSDGEEIHAAWAAHGSLYLWQNAGVVIPGGSRGWSPVPTAVSGGVDWRGPLGAPVGPAEGLPFAERAAVAGARIVLATRAGFLLAGLRHVGATQALGGGSPIAHAGGAGWWVGWSADGGTPRLRAGPVEAGGEALRAEPVEAPAEAAPARGARVVLSRGRAYWIGSDGGIWVLDCSRGSVERVISPREGIRTLWAEADGPRSAWERLAQISVGLSAPLDGRFAFVAPAGNGPLCGVYSDAGATVVVGERAVAFDSQTGARLHEAARPTGRWIDGALARGDDGEPRLLALTVEGTFASLSALRMSSGAQDVLWREAGVEPRALLPVGRWLYVIHRRGVVRLSEGSK